MPSGKSISTILSVGVKATTTSVYVNIPWNNSNANVTIVLRYKVGLSFFSQNYSVSHSHSSGVTSTSMYSKSYNGINSSAIILGANIKIVVNGVTYAGTACAYCDIGTSFQIPILPT